ncbi:hypothetical protein ShirakiTB12_27070 [Priestia megaterium]|uniref:Uncharacterized protein n=1 Tax=Priestia megaterium TaxID=1404 RepID=A0AAX6BKK4_PRIMG|nr:hypothetical protein ShirakiTB12_27070 [Priestia megaterium]
MLSNQLLEATKYMKTTFTMPIKKNPNEVDSPSRISIHRSDLSSTKLLSSQPIFL